MQLTIMGYVRSPLTDKAHAPKMETEDAPQASIVLDEAVAEAAADLGPGQEIDVITWLHKADRGYLSVHPRGDESRPRRGVFATRSPDRPNPLGLHRVRIIERQGLVIRVDRLEALDGTPVVDIKPAVHGTGRPDWGAGLNHDICDGLCRAGRRGWKRKLFSGWNGNVSRRDAEFVHITRSGCAKGFLAPGDILKTDMEGAVVAGSGKPSMETFMHLSVYRAVYKARAVVHTHPPNILALGFRLPFESMLDLPLYEAGVFKDKLGVAPPAEPGSAELARAVGQAAARVDRDEGAVFMERHGLICWAATLDDAVSISEEMEALAGIQLQTL